MHKVASRLAVLLAAAAPPSAAPAAAAPSPGDISIAVGGDLLGPYHPVLGVGDRGFTEVIRLVQSSDTGFANEEGSVFDLKDYHGYPAAENGGGLPLAISATAADFRAMGLTMLSKANNHATDWNVDGLRLTEQALDAAGVVHAGSGESEDAARAPAYLPTAKARIALVATASTFTPMSQAANVSVHKGMPLRARPGISVIGTSSAMVVAPADFAALSALAARRGLKVAHDSVTLGEETFVLGDGGGLRYTADGQDEEAVISSVRIAADSGALPILSIHAHETASGDPEDPAPADFLPPLLRRAIDAGAAMAVRHGPHALAGIEIYHGRPIFYGMGSLVFDFGGRRDLPRPDGSTIRFPDSWFDSALAVVRFHAGKLAEVLIYPLVLTVSAGPTGGLPHLAHGADADRILERLQRVSRPFGTLIGRRGDVGILAIAPAGGA